MPDWWHGIYAIASDSDWLYVGFSRDVVGRRTSHMTALRHHCHSNRLLQRYWDGGAPMRFVLLQILQLEINHRQRGQNPAEIQWKRRLRPVCDRESRTAQISFLLDPYSTRTGPRSPYAAASRHVARSGSKLTIGSARERGSELDVARWAADVAALDIEVVGLAVVGAELRLVRAVLPPELAVELVDHVAGA